MFSLNKFETVGILGSTAIMAILLMIVNNNSETANVLDTREQEAAVVVATDDAPDGSLETELFETNSEDGVLSQLIIEDIVVGDGEVVENGDTLVVNYRGRTPDGQEFDSSYKRGEPFVFTIGRGIVIQGWDEGLIGMREGGQRVLVIPSHMAYGEMQVGIIEPNTPLVFTVELIDIR